ncbi:MAG: chloride channel protein, partial [Acidimicrobiia bacterium]|nr:chloride channel protein [Acidimicrobiia bacterium]
LFLVAIDRSENLADRLFRRAWLRPVVIGLIIATLGFFEPRILGTGQDLTSEVLQLQTTDTFLWSTLLALALLKILSTAGTLSSRASGGAFFPSLFIGASLGAGFASLVAPVWGITDLRPGAFAVVGMAATFAAVARAPLTSIIIVFEITGLEYGLVLPLMLAATLATSIVDRIHPESVYTLPLVRRGIRLVRATEGDVLDNVTVGEVMTLPGVVLEPAMPLGVVQGILDRERHHGLPVIDKGRLVGIVTVTDIARLGGPSDQVTAGEAMTPKPVTVSPATPVSMALERMAALGVGRLPVVSESDPSVLVGIFRRESAVQAYHVGLAASTGERLATERFRQRTDPGAAFFDFRIPPGSAVGGRLIREVPWPEGCTLVSVRRHRSVMVPVGNTELAEGDVITAFGTDGARRLLIERLNAGADEPTAEVVLRPDLAQEDG